MLFHDRATIEGNVRITSEGYLVADAYVALANNIQEYTAGELQLTDRAADAVVRVFRPEAEIFAKDSVKTASRLPITLDHPSTMVDAKNWRDLAKGETGEEIMRDGDRMRVPLRVTDAGAVQSMTTDRKEFSLGYVGDIEMQAGEFNGQTYDAVMRRPKYNHLAACKTARGGPSLKIIDERQPAPKPEDRNMTLKTITFDGLQVADVSPAAEAVILKLQGQVTDAATAKAKAETDLAAAVTTVSTKDAEIATLKTQLADAALTPAKLNDAAKAYALVVAQGKALGATVTDGMDADTIKAAVVNAKLGDAAKGWTADQIAVSFATLAKDAKVEDADPLRLGLADAVINDDNKPVLDAYTAMVADMKAGKTANTQAA